MSWHTLRKSTRLRSRDRILLGRCLLACGVDGESTFLQQLDECDLGQNNVPPYLHWLVVCEACRRLTLGRALTPCVPIVRFSSNEVVKCSSCSDVRQYLAAQFFLGPFQAPVPPASPVPRHRYAPTLVIAASIIAAVRLAREEDISGRSPRQPSQTVCNSPRISSTRSASDSWAKSRPPRRSVESLVAVTQWCCVMRSGMGYRVETG